MSGGFAVDAGWGNPATEAANQSWVWLHVPARSAIRVVILSESPCRYKGHWVDGHMRPCLPVDCGYCAVRLGFQIRYVFAVHDMTHRVSGLLELGAGAAEVIKESADDLGFLRGLVFELRKEGGRDRGKIIVKAHHAMIQTEGLPVPPDAALELRRMWSLPDAERVG